MESDTTQTEPVAETVAQESKPKWSRKKKYRIVKYDFVDGVMMMDKRAVLDESAKAAILDGMQKEVIARTKAKQTKAVPTE